jgi:hypothetical protein
MLSVPPVFSLATFWNFLMAELQIPIFILWLGPTIVYIATRTLIYVPQPNNSSSLWRYYPSNHYTTYLVLWIRKRLYTIFIIAQDQSTKLGRCDHSNQHTIESGFRTQNHCVHRHYIIMLYLPRPRLPRITNTNIIVFTFSCVLL